METAGIIPEDDEVGEEAEYVDADDAPPEAGEGRLSVFEDFLEQLNLDEDEDEDK